MKTLLTTALMLFASFVPSVNAEEKAPPVPAGTYVLDKTHASLVFTVDHLGFSSYTSSFREFDATLEFDPGNPASSSVAAKIDPMSLLLPSPPEGFTEELLGKQWLDAGRFPAIVFKSEKVEMTGPNNMLIHGTLDLHGVKKPVSLNATYNGGYAGHPMDPRARIGFSATGTFKRSDFGISYGIPAPGSKMGVGDDIKIFIEAEFSGPPLKN